MEQKIVLQNLKSSMNSLSKEYLLYSEELKEISENFIGPTKDKAEAEAREKYSFRAKNIIQIIKGHIESLRAKAEENDKVDVNDVALTNVVNILKGNALIDVDSVAELCKPFQANNKSLKLIKSVAPEKFWSVIDTLVYDYNEELGKALSDVELLMLYPDSAIDKLNDIRQIIVQYAIKNNIELDNFFGEDFEDVRTMWFKKQMNLK